VTGGTLAGPSSESWVSGSHVCSEGFRVTGGTLAGPSSESWVAGLHVCPEGLRTHKGWTCLPVRGTWACIPIRGNELGSRLDGTAWDSRPYQC